MLDADDDNEFELKKSTNKSRNRNDPSNYESKASNGKCTFGCCSFNTVMIIVWAGMVTGLVLVMALGNERVIVQRK